MGKILQNVLKLVNSVYGPKHIFNNFHEPNRTYSEIRALVEKIHKTGSIDRVVNSSQPQTTRTKTIARTAIKLAIGVKNK
uniref:Uncharacterized protein n=1 Tax=Romanomermis culicivorax TaxID=13658 RepID=A0A915K6W9_ROMCU